MIQHFNDLSPAEAERLALLTEECGEVLQAIGKVQRHGYDSRHPDGGPDNRETLQRELGDLWCAIQMMCSARDISDRQLDRDATRKTESVKKWLHHQDTL